MFYSYDQYNELHAAVRGEDAVIQGECNCDECLQMRRDKRVIDILTHPAARDYYNGLPLILSDLDSQETRVRFNIHQTAWDLFKWFEKHHKPLFHKEQRRYYKYYCMDCGAVSPHGFGEHDTPRGKLPLCLKCSKLYAICDECGKQCKSFAESMEWYIDGKRTYCNTCKKSYKTCHSCRKIFPKRMTVALVPRAKDSAWLCQLCYSDGLTECKICHEPIHRLLLNNGKCPRCYDRKAMHAYNYNPTPMFKVDTNKEKMCISSPDRLFFGVELEVYNPDEDKDNMYVAKQVESVYPPGLVYNKFDRSVGGKPDDREMGGAYGFEIVTSPFTWQWFKAHAKVFRTGFTWLHKQGYTGNHWSLGMHVHLSKTAFTTMHLYKFIRFYYNEPNRTFIYAISQRNNKKWFQRYCGWLDRDYGDMELWARDKFNLSRERHSAINMHKHNLNTVEIRIFAGTSKMSEFMKNMEFSYATYLFSRDHTVEDMTPEKFIEWLYSSNNRNKFMNLKKYTQRRKYLRELVESVISN